MNARDPLQLEILSDPSCLSDVRARVESYATEAGLDEAAAARVVLAVDEALTNIIRHAYEHRPDRPIRIEISSLPGELKITLEDFGRSADPDSIQPRDLEDIRPGGLGVHIMRECMDTVQYEPRPEGGTVLTMTKKLDSSTKEQPNDE